MKIQKTIKSLIKNNMQALFVNSKLEAVSFLQNFLTKGSKVGVGDSVTLKQCGIIKFLQEGDYIFNDWMGENITDDKIQEIFANDKKADFYLCSSNAITENGELYNVDGRSNRISCIVHGPKNVIIVAGVNKIVENLESAVYRVKTIAAPLNCKRLNFKNYCTENGQCVSLNKKDPGMTDGCETHCRSCCNYLISGMQRIKNRITVLLVNESLGY